MVTKWLLLIPVKVKHLLLIVIIVFAIAILYRFKMKPDDGNLNITPENGTKEIEIEGKCVDINVDIQFSNNFLILSQFHV